jgi:hypothetical protein
MLDDEADVFPALNPGQIFPKFLEHIFTVHAYFLSLLAFPGARYKMRHSFQIQGS